MDIWLRDAELGDEIASLPWLADGVDHTESFVLRSFLVLALADIELTKSAASLPWLADEVTEDDRHLLHYLEDFASQDIELTRLVLGFNWLKADTLEGGQWRRVLRELQEITAIDTELARLTARSLSSVGRVTDDEVQAVYFMKKVAQTDLNLARTAATLPWMADGVTENEWETLWALSIVASIDLDLARTVITLPWLTDGVTENEVNPIFILGGIASIDLDMARTVITLPWVLDGLTVNEWRMFSNLKWIASEDLDLASQVLNLTSEVLTLPWVEGNWDRDLNQYLRLALTQIAASQGADAFSQMTAQTWFADGLSEEEAALIVTLRTFNNYESSPYQDLLKNHYTQTRTVSLPLAGEVNIWVVQANPFPPDEDLLTIIEDTARISEEFLRVPFPTADIILLVVSADYGLSAGIYSGIHLGAHMKVTRYGGFEGEVPSIPHETAHYYFGDVLAGPGWFFEGGAEFIEAYFNNLTGVQDINHRRNEVSERVQNQCIDHRAFENIRHLTYAGVYSVGCLYSMGENLFLALLETMGEEALRSALHELSLLSFDQETHLSTALEEDQIYRVFLEHTPPGRKEEFRKVYRRLHGGPPVANLSDDHGDEASAATDLQVGDVIDGTLDYVEDFDYFRFQAEEGQKYWINVVHDTLSSTSISLYGPDGHTKQLWIIRDRGPAGPRILWEAKYSSEYYFAVLNFGGKTGEYTVTITPVDATPGDHSDTPATAT